MIEENKLQKLSHNKEYYSDLLANSIQTQKLTDDARKGILQIFVHTNILGNIQYSQQLIQLIFPYLRIQNHNQADLLDPFSDKFQFKCLLSGEALKFIKKNSEKTHRRFESQRCLNFRIQQLEQKYQIKYVQTVQQPFQSLESSNSIFVSGNKCKVLILELDQFTKDVLETKFDKMRLFFTKHFGDLIKDRSEILRQMQYFKRQNKKFKQQINLTNKLYFIDEGTIETYIDQNHLPVQMQSGSVAGIEQFSQTENRKYTHKVKSLKVTGYSLKISNIAKLGREWFEFLQNAAKQQRKIWIQIMNNFQRKTNHPNKIDRLNLFKSNYEIRKKTLSVQNSIIKVLDKMHCMEERVVLNYKISQKMKGDLPKIDHLNTILAKSNSKNNSKRFNPYKQLDQNRVCEKSVLEKRGFDYYLKLHIRNTSSSLRTSPQRTRSDFNRSSRTFSKFQFGNLRKKLSKRNIANQFTDFSWKQ